MAESGIEEQDEVPGRVKDVMCQPCLSKDNKKVAVLYCSTCNEFYCNDCSSMHNVLAILKSHTLVKAKEASATRDLVDLKRLDQCDQHQKVLKFFCEDEKELCCSTCAIVDHRKCHSVVEVEEIAGKMMSLTSYLEKLHEVRKDAEGIARHIVSSKTKLAQDVNALPKKLRRMRDQVMKMFDDLKDTIVKKAASLQEEILGHLSKKLSRNEKYLADVNKFLETIDSVYKTGSPAQKFMVEERIKDEVNVLCRNVKAECQNLETETISFHFDETIKLPPQPIEEYVPGQIILKSHYFGHVDSGDKPLTLTPVISIDLMKTEDDIEEPIYTGIDFLPDGRLVAVDTMNRKCLVHNEKLERVGSYQLSYRPYSVVVVSEKEVAITSGGKIIKFLRVSKGNELSLNRQCKVKMKYDSICIKDDTHFIVGTYDGPTPVRIVSMTGEEKDLSINFPNNTYSVDESYCTFIESSDKLVFTDRWDQTVYIYDFKTGSKIVVKDDEIQQPCGVAVGPSDTILLCCSGNNLIVQISQRGHILSSHKIDMNNPYKLCVSRDKSFLVVTNSKKGIKKMQKFKIS